MAEVWDLSRGEGAWMPTFVRLFNDWELDIVQNFFCLITCRSVNQMEKDSLHWKGGKIGMYIVKESYELLVGGNTRIVPMKILWNSYVPPKVCFFAWEVWWGKVLTMDQLKKRGFQMASRCPLCGKAK